MFDKVRLWVDRRRARRELVEFYRVWIINDQLRATKGAPRIPFNGEAIARAMRALEGGADLTVAVRAFDDDPLPLIDAARRGGGL